jgi:hypothetical protein
MIGTEILPIMVINAENSRKITMGYYIIRRGSKKLAQIRREYEKESGYYIRTYHFSMRNCSLIPSHSAAE